MYSITNILFGSLVVFKVRCFSQKVRYYLLILNFNA